MFKNINFYNYKNISNKKINMNADCIFIYGDNGEGKSNFSSSLYFLCYGSDPFLIKESNSINFNYEQASIIGHYLDNNNSLKQIKIIMDKQNEYKKDIYLDDKKIVDRKEFISLFPCIFITYNDLRLILGTPSDQRKFFNQSIAFNNNDYIDLLREQSNIIKNRNLILKKDKVNKQDRDLIELYDKKVASISISIIDKRIKIIDFFNKNFDIIKDIITKDNDFRIEYKSDLKGKNDKEIFNFLQNNLENDIKRKITNRGIHKDKFNIKRSNKDFSVFSSIGEKRIVTIFLKIIQANIIYQNFNIKPIIVLDDAFLELDYQKTEKLLRIIPPFRQLLFSTSKKEDIEYAYEILNELHKIQNSSLFYKIKEGILNFN